MSPEEKLRAAVMALFEHQFTLQREHSERRMAEFQPVLDDIEALRERVFGRLEEIRENGKELSGKTVYFAEAPRCKLNGETIIESAFKPCAEAIGMTVARRMTNRVEVLVVPDDDVDSVQASEAKQGGVSVLLEREFWEIIGLIVDDY